MFMGTPADQDAAFARLNAAIARDPVNGARDVVVANLARSFSVGAPAAPVFKRRSGDGRRVQVA